MLEHTGQIPAIARPWVPLLLIPLLPLLAAAVIAALGARAQRIASRIAAGAAGLAFALALADVIALQSDRALHDVAWRMVRIGSLDVNLAFTMDTLSGVLALIIAGAAAILHVPLERRAADEAARPRVAAALGLLTGAALTLVLADNLVVMLFGWEGIALGAAALLTALDPRAASGTRAFVTHRAGDALLLAGAALLFWGAGGQWLADGRYLPDYRARFVAVSENATPDKPRQARDEEEDDDGGSHASVAELRARAGARGYLTFTSHPGARVFLGLADRAQLASTPEPFAVSPFLRKEIPVGAHSIIIVPGDGATVSGDGFEVAAIDRVSVEPGEEITLAPLGPTMTFRELRDQLALKDAAGARFLRDELAAKRSLGGLGLVPLACFLLFAGAAARSAALPLRAWRPGGAPAAAAWITAAVAALAGAYLALRMDFLFELAPVGSGVAAVLLFLLPFTGAAAARVLPARARPGAGGGA
jgi:NADH-quinone oxidoreductase subunit L